MTTARLDCPYCGEPIEIVIDEGAPDAEYVDDCEVCCRPMVITVALGSDGPLVSARTEND